MATQISFRNPSASNSVKLTMQDAVMVDKKEVVDGKEVVKQVFKGQWKSTPNYTIVKPNEHGTAFVNATRRVIIEELPT